MNKIGNFNNYSQKYNMIAINNKIRNKRRYFFIISFLILLVSFSLIPLSCSPESEINENIPTGGIRIMVNVNGITGVDVIQPVAKAAIASAFTSNTRKQDESGFTIDGTSTQISIENSADNDKLHNALAESSNKRSIINEGVVKSTSPMSKGNTYRILIYNKKTGVLWKTLQAISGNPVPIDVEKGSSYVWYAYSYNDQDNIPEPVDKQNPTIDTSIEKDFIYATGEISIPLTNGNQDNYPVNIVFAHKVAQVNIQIDATRLADVATIRELRASFANDKYLKKGTFNIKGNKMENKLVVSKTIIFDNVVPFDNKWEAKYYTADPQSLTTYTINIDKLDVYFRDAAPQDANIDLAAVNPGTKPYFTFKYVSPAEGQSLVGIGNLLYTMRSLKMLQFATYIDQDLVFGGITAEKGWAGIKYAPYEFLMDSQNFGTNLNSKVRMKGWNSNFYNGLSLLSFLNELKKNPDVVILGYLTDVNLIKTDIIDYLKKGGVVLMFSEYDLANRPFFTTLFGTTITSDISNGAGAMYRIEGTSKDDVIINGKFGDLRGGDHYFGEDVVGTSVIGKLPSDEVTVYGKGTAINRTENHDHAASMFKHNKYNLFFVGDGGFISFRTLTTPLEASPCKFDSNNQPIPKSYGNAGNGYVAGSKQTSNSFLFGNVMQWAAMRAEFAGVNPWKYKK
ncbi:hypothetical protein CMU93_00585 [Elizabethkingia anophelis]|nr:hypothetical protein [Elizabethkingia anophelis]